RPFLHLTSGFDTASPWGARPAQPTLVGSCGALAERRSRPLLARHQWFRHGLAPAHAGRASGALAERRSRPPAGRASGALAERRSRPLLARHWWFRLGLA